MNQTILSIINDVGTTVDNTGQFIDAFLRLLSEYNAPEYFTFKLYNTQATLQGQGKTCVTYALLY